MNRSTLSEQLKLQTLPEHQRVEKLLIAQMRSITSLDKYIKLLNQFYGYFGGLEEKINKHIGIKQLGDYPKRRKTQSLSEDIKIFGGTIPEKAEGADLPEIENHLQAFGALYVIEGSTLGGKIISKIIKKQLNIQNDEGVSFFNGYGDETEKMWETFKEILNTKTMNQVDATTVVNAANDTFAKFKLWIEKICLTDTYQ